jgi:hypothetical protein
VSIDLRTRADATVVPVTADELFDRLLPAALAERPSAIHVSSRALRPLLVEVGHRAWTLHPTGRIQTGDHTDPNDRRAHVKLTEVQASDLAIDQVTPIGLMTAGELDQPAGRIGHLLDWWLVWRAALDDDADPTRTPEPTAAIDLPEPRSFTLDDDPAELRAFLERAGYLHLRGVFDTIEMAAVSADMDAAAPRYSPGDGRSWWAGKATGEQVLVRMQGFDEHSPITARLLEDQRFTSLGAIAGCGHTHTGLERNRVEALFKPLGITSGISDVPWHKDCSLGRHSYECCTLTVGVSVTGAGPGSGQLRVIAGSHRARVWPSLLDTTELALPEVALPTETGDVTIHLSCTLHMAEPPTVAPRRVLYTTFRLPVLDPSTQAATEAGRNRLFRVARERAPLTTDQPVPGG